MDTKKEKKKLHIKTPLLESTALSLHLNRKVYIKMDVLQRGGSFKIRGIGHFCQKKLAEGYSHFISSSAGNAGLATAYAGRKLGVPVTVVVPENTAPLMRTKIEREGAKVIAHGTVWSETNQMAMDLAAKDPGKSVLIHPFDHPDLWEGHSSIIEEVAEDLKEDNEKPAVIVMVIGGGGLFCGVCQGLHKVGWNDVPIVVAETFGAHTFNVSVQKGEPVTLESEPGVPKTVHSSKKVCAESVNWAKKHPIRPTIVTELQAVRACLRFSEDERVLIEPTWGAGLACLYDKVESLRQILDSNKDGCVLVIVCGGNAVTYPMLQSLEAKLASQESGGKT